MRDRERGRERREKGSEIGRQASGQAVCQKRLWENFVGDFEHDT